MAAFGTGSQLWRVDVVLRLGAAPSDASTKVLSLLAAWQGDLPTLADENVHPSLRETGSYDLPAPGGEVGVSCWVRADSVGDAAQLAFGVLSRAYTEVSGLPADLWDLRLLPRSAITGIREVTQRADVPITGGSIRAVAADPW
jgi:hypothetical protein